MASTYPATLDNLSKLDREDPDVVDSVNAVQAVHQPALIGQTIAYAASITPDPRAGEVVTVGTLTGAITIANPPAGAQQVGRRIVFKLTQDGTGTRAVTWGGGYLGAPSTSTDAAGKVRSVSFIWDGAVWLCTGTTIN